tara:strand:- start:2998 stop:3405 length:408 start_codon:yes stop_codon:yes gene_type:complete
MSYNGKVWSVSTGIANETIEQRLVDFELPKEVMEKLYIPIDGKVYISNGSGHTAILKLDNSSGGRELEMGLRIDGQTPPTDWWDKGSDKVQRTIKRIPADVLSYLGFGLVDDQLRIKYTVDTSTWSATLEKISVI